jgi:hypothetical protein
MFRRHWVLLLLLYVGVDFFDPSLPGVFFLDNDALFMDGVVQTKGHQSATPENPGPVPYSVALIQVVEPRQVPSRPMLGGPSWQWPVRQGFARPSLSQSASARATEDH